MFFGRKTAPVTWIAVFLGNPGARYENTRHNVGYMTADVIGKNTGIKVNRMKFSALTGATVIGEHNVFLMKPQTYMNLSGNAVSHAMKFFRVPLSNVVVVCDDVALPAGKLRVRRRGSAGGHNGLKDIIAKCGGEDFPRIKIGVGAPPHVDYNMADWVLSKLSDKDAKLLAEAADGAAKALVTLIAHGVEQAMAKYN